MPPDAYRYAGHPGESLANGRALVPLEAVPADQVDLDDPHDVSLVDEGKLLPLDTTPSKLKPAPRAEEDDQ